jgi:hypothetical protein
VRARNRPAFLLVWDPTSLPATYELDPQGFDSLRAALGDNTGWCYFRKRDGGVPVTAFSVVLTAMGAYGPNQVGVGTGWTVVGDAGSGGAYEPYSYAGVYTTVAEDAAEMRLTLADAPALYEVPIAENIDMRPYVFSSRMSDGDSRFQVNLEPVFEDSGLVTPFSTPVGVDFWISPGDYWYGGVFITRDLDDEENYDTQVWCGDLAGITLVGPKPFYPLDLFLPGDRGGFYNPNHENTLFQTRTGPTVPVTGNGDPVQFMVDENGQFNLARTLAAPGFEFQNGLLEASRGGALFGTLSSGNVAGFGQVTVVMGGVINTPIPIEANTIALGFDVDNTTAFGGAGITINLAPSPSVRLLNWVPPSSSPTANMSIPANELGSPFVFGYRQDEASPTQHMFFNDVELTPTITYSPVTPQASGAEYIGTAGQDGAPVVSVFGGPAFFIDRQLSDTELAQLKTWMRDNTPTP